MDLTAKLGELDVAQLKEALSRADGELEDVLDEQQFVLSQTGVHIGAGELVRMKDSWAKDETRLRERIEAIKARLADLQSMP